MEQAIVLQCECGGDDDDHVDHRLLTWSDGTTVNFPVRCLENDIDPYADLQEVASTGAFWTESMPVRGYMCTLRPLTDDLWEMDSGEMDEQPEVVAIRGTLKDALYAWLSEGEAVAPGTRRCLAARLTGALDDTPTDREGSRPQYLYTGSVPDTEPNVDAVFADAGDAADLLRSILSEEITWVTNPDTSPGSWQSRLVWWQQQHDSHG